MTIHLSSACCFLLYLSLCYAQLSTDQCDDVDARGINLEQAKFLFTHSYKSCPDFTIEHTNQLTCSDGEYIRIGARFNSAPYNESIIFLNRTIQYIGSSTGSGCVSLDQKCGNVACTPVEPFEVYVAASRRYVRYYLKKLGTVPFSFLPTDLSPGSCSGVDDCTCEYQSSSSYPTGPPCGFTDPITGPLDTNCGANRDPDTGFSDQTTQACDTVCCGACSAQLTPTINSHRRATVGPVCSVYSITGSDWISHVNVFVKTNTGNLVGTIEDLSPGSVRVFTQSPSSSQNKLRLYVNKHYGSRFSRLGQASELNGGIFVVCNYTMDETNQLSRYNPYVTLEPALTFNDVTYTAPFLRMPPVTAPFADKGAGLVPTNNSLARNVSMFYVPYPLSIQFASVTSEGYMQSQKQVLNSWAVKVDGSSFKNATWWAEFTNVPGWEENPSNPGQPLVASPCKMSHDLNTYAMAFQTALMGNGGDYVAAKQTAGTPPPWLPPNFDILNPNWWPNFSDGASEIMFDASSTHPGEREAYELYIDFSQEFVQEINGPAAVIQFDERTNCIYNRDLLSGNFTVFVTNIDTSSDSSNYKVDLSVNCSFLLRGNMRVVAAFANEINMETNLPIPALSTQVSTPFTFLFPGSNVSEVVSAQCSVNASTTDMDNIITSLPYTCLIPISNMDLPGYNQAQNDINNAGQCNPCDWGCLNAKGELWSSGCFIFTCVIVAIVLIAILALLIGCCVAQSNAKKLKAGNKKYKKIVSKK